MLKLPDQYTLRRPSTTNYGFTLIELLIVIAILGVLATFGISTFPAAQGRARDTQRKSDLNQYRVGLENYANNNSGSYPIRASAVKPATLCATLGLSSCTQDPKDGTSTCNSGTCQYQYVTNPTGSTYALWMRTERPTGAATLTIFCSNGRSYESSTTPSSTTPCP